jgi:hypothetical protein
MAQATTVTTVSMSSIAVGSLFCNGCRSMCPINGIKFYVGKNFCPDCWQKMNVWGPYLGVKFADYVMILTDILHSYKRSMLVKPDGGSGKCHPIDIDCAQLDTNPPSIFHGRLKNEFMPKISIHGDTNGIGYLWGFRITVGNTFSISNLDREIMVAYRDACDKIISGVCQYEMNAAKLYAKFLR